MSLGWAAMLHMVAMMFSFSQAVDDGQRAIPPETPCAEIPRYENGREVGRVCPSELAPGLSVIALGDRWAPRIFSETPDHPQPYRDVFVELANGQLEDRDDLSTAHRDRYFELFGIFPSLGIIRARLLDEPRHACHAAIDDEELRALTRTLAPWNVTSSRATAAALTMVQRHLQCEGLLSQRAINGKFDGAMQEALRLYQRRHMVPSAGVLDADTRATLLTDSRELDFRTLLRTLRERVVDATGLIEDGSAADAWEPVLGRFIESSEYRHPLRSGGLEGGAPDLIARATEAAARALGWTSPADATHALAHPHPAQVALRLPPLPAYHQSPMRLRVEIDRGDVWTSYPLDHEGKPRPSPAKNRPTLTLFALTTTGEVPLVRWPTTIGAWKPEKFEDGSESLRYKESPVGRSYWRDLLVAPAWFPPPTTPDRELMRRGPDGKWIADRDGVGPGYRSAYGLVALVHHRAVGASGSGTVFVDLGIRSHGSGNYRSILRGSSHGCHRLFNHLAIRLGSFLLAHHDNVRHGVLDERYQRTIPWRGRTYKLRASSRGYRYELVPPMPVEVLPGRTVRSKRLPAVPDVPPAPAAKPVGAPQSAIRRSLPLGVG